MKKYKPVLSLLVLFNVFLSVQFSSAQNVENKEIPTEGSAASASITIDPKFKALQEKAINDAQIKVSEISTSTAVNTVNKPVQDDLSEKSSALSQNVLILIVVIFGIWIAVLTYIVTKKNSQKIN